MKQENVSGKDTEFHTFRITKCLFKDNCLPSLNDLLGKNPLEYNRLKRNMEMAVITFIRRDLRGYKPTCRVALDIEWGEKNKGRKRDYDNVVAAGRKIINDSLVKSGVLKDDSPTYLGYGDNTFCYVNNPYVEVKIREITNDTEASDITVH